MHIEPRNQQKEDRVFDIVKPSGLKRSVALWNNKEVEIFFKVTAT